MTLDENLNQLSWSWTKVAIWAIEIGITAFLLRPSKCKQVYENLCFAKKQGEEAPAEEPRV